MDTCFLMATSCNQQDELLCAFEIQSPSELYFFLRRPFLVKHTKERQNVSKDRKKKNTHRLDAA